jgi:hypothetical protein
MTTYSRYCAAVGSAILENRRAGAVKAFAPPDEIVWLTGGVVSSLENFNDR